MLENSLQFAHKMYSIGKYGLILLTKKQNRTIIKVNNPWDIYFLKKYITHIAHICFHLLHHLLRIYASPRLFSIGRIFVSNIHANTFFLRKKFHSNVMDL